ncbi:uncharacterized protein ARMOST_14245 [Armillaria ostoyae]|uniref:Uncharacterized protein n=1 Tax=Armillaria ostoyae TaxID=47428 RepID=A0A284RQ21_ARMOS|nr:uncharacterized protein ARMOST_14245 [Armillaria ostoyae]
MGTDSSTKGTFYQKAACRDRGSCYLYRPCPAFRVSSTLAALELVLITHDELLATIDNDRKLFLAADTKWATAVKEIWREVSIPIVVQKITDDLIIRSEWESNPLVPRRRCAIRAYESTVSTPMRREDPKFKCPRPSCVTSCRHRTGIWTSVSLGRDAKELLDTYTLSLILGTHASIALWIVVSLLSLPAECAAVLWSKIAKRHRHQINIMLWVGVEHTHACVKQFRCAIRAQGVGRRRSRDLTFSVHRLDISAPRTTAHKHRAPDSELSSTREEDMSFAIAWQLYQELDPGAGYQLKDD